MKKPSNTWKGQHSFSKASNQVLKTFDLTFFRDFRPKQIKWLLMIGACHRRAGNYQNAYNCYKSIHNSFPENMECLKFLVRVSNDLGLKESFEFTEKLRKLEKNKEIKDQRVMSGVNGINVSRSTSRASTRRSAASSREGSASSSSSGYLTSASPRSTAISKNNGNKREVDSNKNIVDISVYDSLSIPNERPTTSWKRNAVKDEDDFGNDEIVDILPD